MCNYKVITGISDHDMICNIFNVIWWKVRTKTESYNNIVVTKLTMGFPPWSVNFPSFLRCSCIYSMKYSFMFQVRTQTSLGHIHDLLWRFLVMLLISVFIASVWTWAKLSRFGNFNLVQNTADWLILMDIINTLPLFCRRFTLWTMKPDLACCSLSPGRPEFPWTALLSCTAVTGRSCLLLKNGARAINYPVHIHGM